MNDGEESIEKTADAIVLLCGKFTRNSISKEEKKVSMNFPIPLRPIVINSLTKSLEFLVGRKKKVLAEATGAFLSDIIDEGMLSIIEGAEKRMKVANEKTKSKPKHDEEWKKEILLEGCRKSVDRFRKLSKEKQEDLIHKLFL